MNIAIVGATGLVGSKMLQILEERNFSIDKIIPIASQKSEGRLINFCGKKYAVVSILVIAAIVTPPDVITQIILFSVVYSLYEISIFLVKLVEKKKNKFLQELDEKV